MADTPHLQQCAWLQVPAPAGGDSRGCIVLKGDSETQKVWHSGSFWVVYWNHQEALSLPNLTVHHVSTFSLEMSVFLLLGLAWGICPGTPVALTTTAVFLTLFQAHLTPGPAGNTTNPALLCTIFELLCYRNRDQAGIVWGVNKEENKPDHFRSLCHIWSEFGLPFERERYLTDSFLSLTASFLRRNLSSAECLII